MASHPATFFVPTLDIDLVWHTHQLISEKYQSDCTTYVGRFIDQWVKFIFPYVCFKLSDIFSVMIKWKDCSYLLHLIQPVRPGRWINDISIWNIWHSLIITDTNATGTISCTIQSLWLSYSRWYHRTEINSTHRRTKPRSTAVSSTTIQPSRSALRDAP